MKRIVFVLILITGYNVCIGQEQLLNSQLGTFQLRFRALMSERGFSWYHSTEIGLHTLQSAMTDYYYGLPDSTGALLFYHHNRDTLYSWLINKKGILASDRIAISADSLLRLEIGLKLALNADAPEQSNRGADVANTSNSIKRLTDYRREASEALFPKELSKAMASIRFLIIVPELNISSFPLYYLQPTGGTQSLLDFCSISIAHSLDEFLNRTVFYTRSMYNYSVERFYSDARNYRTLTYTPSASLVVGNPDFGKCSDRYKQLIGAEQEAQLVAQRFNTTALIGKEATKQNVLKKLSKSEFVYLATHAHSDTKDPLNNSHIVFAGTEKDCGYWTAKEIQYDTLPYEAIVVLSACQTALGKVLEAGIIGLSRAFIKARAGNVIMSLWSVDDKATKELMNHFTEELFLPSHFFPAENLRKAMLKYREENPSPNDWASFLNMGTPYPPAIKYHMQVEK
ncbi:MAG: CHAT domain-containing protein [Chitinophagales bacterium]|nr:CHAT domain-containing protein [Chitinophagales bacterium]